jgi:hypothetical protein
VAHVASTAVKCRRKKKIMFLKPFCKRQNKMGKMNRAKNFASVPLQLIRVKGIV